MRKTKLKSLNRILSDKTSSLNKIQSHQMLLDRYQEKINSILDSDLSQYCRLANVREQCLIFHCDSAAWATRLRFQGTMLQQQMSQRYGMKVKMGDIVIRHNAPLFKENSRHRQDLSTSTRHFLAQTAENMSDPELAAAFARLARVKKEEK